nr:pyrimidine/purine nucleoside phosphorylase [Kitasatospora sp. MBT63]
MFYGPGWSVARPTRLSEKPRRLRRGGVTFTVNEYLDGTVKSIAFQQEHGRATIGVMAPGDYRFDTAGPETIHVISGALTVRLPGADAWRTFAAGTRFDVRAPAPSTSRWSPTPPTSASTADRTGRPAVDLAARRAGAEPGGQGGRAGHGARRGGVTVIG